MRKKTRGRLDLYNEHLFVKKLRQSGKNVFFSSVLSPRGHTEAYSIWTSGWLKNGFFTLLVIESNGDIHLNRKPKTVATEIQK
jgi:hypothetical protein